MIYVYCMFILRIHSISRYALYYALWFLRNLTFESDSFFLKEVAVGVTSRLCRLNEQYLCCKN